MSKLVILRGVSGSGKSTYARNQNGIVVSRDDIRVMLFGSDGPDYYSVDKEVLRNRENAVTVARDAQIEAFLRAGYTVYSDDTNIEWKFVKALAKIGHDAGAEVEIKVFDVPLRQALLNNSYRANRGGRNVPEEAIKKQHQRFQGNKGSVLDAPFIPKPYAGTPGKPKALIVDIDGTLAHMNRGKGGRSPFHWSRVGEDSLDDIIADIVDFLSLEYRIVVMSGRDSSCRQETIDWLDHHDIIFHELFMRGENDSRKDNIIKAELFDEHVRGNFDVKFVLDDRDQVVAMWRAMGIKCLQVEPGNF